VTTPVDKLQVALADRYRIERELGAGGMATVHLAHDLKHDRKVALKVLRAELAAVIGVERFLNEIRVTANLQHPHILPLYDSGAVDGVLYYVMPYVEGETLADRLRREKQLSVADSVRIATEAAAALDYAHRHGIVHRDIKPANILLQDGGVLVADFGIALALRAAGGDRITETGLSLGTPHYMSPEQAAGDRDVDLRTDIYALGAVLYEMLAGEPPHTGNTAQAIISRVMTEEPRALTTVRSSVPDHVSDAVDTALSKVPADRFASAAEFATALRDVSHTRATRARAVTAAASVPLWRRLVWPGVAAAAAVVATWSITRGASSPRVSMYEMTLPEEVAPAIDLPEIVVTPDGNRIVYVGLGEKGVGQQLWMRERGALHATALHNTDGAVTLAMSPDGQSVAFLSLPSRLRTISLDGGVTSSLTENAGSAEALAWGDDGEIYISYANAIRRIPARGGSLLRVDSMWPAEAARRNGWLAVLPGSKALLGSIANGSERNIVALDIATGASHPVTSGVFAAYAPSGFLVVVSQQGGVTAARFNPRNFSLGQMAPLAENVSARAGSAVLAVAAARLVYVEGPQTTSNVDEAVWVARSGVVTPIDPTWKFASQGNSGWSVSPDGTQLAIKLNSESGQNIWIRDLRSQALRRITFDSGGAFRPRWSPDGRYVTYIGARHGDRTGVYRRRADGTGSEESVMQLPLSIAEAQISPDGNWVIGRTGGASLLPAQRDIWKMRISGDTTITPLLNGPAEERAFDVSPDGKWFAYSSDESGKNEVYVRPFPDVGSGKWQISVGGGEATLWNPRGKELFYVNGASELVVVDLWRGPAQPGERKVLFSLRGFRQSTNYTWFDVDPSGERFLMVREARETNRLTVVENFPALLNKK
jgi:serine/threonine-protein kinase